MAARTLSSSAIGATRSCLKCSVCFADNTSHRPWENAYPEHATRRPRIPRGRSSEHSVDQLCCLFLRAASAEGALSHVGLTFWSLPAGSSCQAQFCERCASLSATLIRQNPQLKNSHVAKFHGVILSLTYCPRRAKIPLLANNFSEGTPAIR